MLPHACKGNNSTIFTMRSVVHQCVLLLLLGHKDAYYAVPCCAVLYLLCVLLLAPVENDAYCLLQCAGIEYVIVRIHFLTKHVLVIRKAYTIHLSYAPALTVKPVTMSQLTAVLLSSLYVS